MPAAVVRRRPALLLAALLLAACGPSHDVGRRSPSAVLLDGARNVEYARFDSEESIAYDLAPPPALDEARERIDRALHTAGWTAAIVETPRPYVDARGGKREPVEYWRGTWSRGGEVAEYILERRADRLHVWGRIGPPEPGPATVSRWAPHPAFGHALPTSVGRGTLAASVLLPACGEKVPEGRMRGYAFDDIVTSSAAWPSS